MAPGNASRLERPRAWPWRRTACRGLDWLACVGPENVAEFGAALRGEGALTGEFAGFIASAFRTAVSEGIAGWRDDDLAFARGWGFFLGIAAPSLRVAIWQGDQDRMVPFAHGQRLAANIPGVRAHLFPGEGRLTLTVTAIGRILDDLLGLAGLS